MHTDFAEFVCWCALHQSFSLQVAHSRLWKQMIGKIFWDYWLIAIFMTASYSNLVLCLGRVALDSAEAEALNRLDVGQIVPENSSELCPSHPCSFEIFGHLKVESWSGSSAAWEQQGIESLLRYWQDLKLQIAAVQDWEVCLEYGLRVLSPLADRNRHEHLFQLS